MKTIQLALYYLFAIWLPGNNRNGFSCRIRVFLLRNLFRRSGKDINILRGAEIANAHNFTIGDNSGVGMYCHINCEESVNIGERVLMGPEVMMFTSNHIWNSELNTYYSQGLTRAPINIEDDVWIGARSIILPGVTIGQGATIAAGAVVTSDVEAFSVAAGIPARVIKIKDHTI